MFAICIEASHKKGMGHLFRMLNFTKYLKNMGNNFIFIINDDEKTKNILESKDYKYEVVELHSFIDNWETILIKEYSFTYWINDRLNTNKQHAKNILQNNIKLITFDDLGKGSGYSDINICGLFFNNENLQGKKILKGTEYLILNPEIKLYKRERTKLKNILLTLGGSDTYGITIKVLKLLKKHKIKTTIHIGPSFKHIKELELELTEDYKLIHFIPSLIKEFSKYDLAITGGGITPFEANASGLPCLIIANEFFEIPNGKYLDTLGTSLFLEYHKNINENIFENIKNLDINKMSKKGLSSLDIKATEKIYKEILSL